MTQSLFNRKPAGLDMVPEANALWETLAKLVTDDTNPVVTLPEGDELIGEQLDLLAGPLGAVTVTDGDKGSKVVTLILADEATEETPAPKSAVKEAASASSSFAGERRE